MSHRKPHTAETKRKIGLANSGRVSKLKGTKRSEEFKAKIKKSRQGQIFTVETRKKMSDAHKGEKCHWWKGGRWHLREERHEIMAGFEYRLWRKAVFERDNYTCIWCGDDRGGNLEADHIQTFKDNPELRLAIDNGRTLCHDCHVKRHRKYGGTSVSNGVSVSEHDSNEESILPE